MPISTTVTSISPVKLIPERPGYFRELQPEFGSRHITEDAPFTLWDFISSDFRTPTDAEWNWLRKRFNASYIVFEFPDIIITTNVPQPQPIPLTVAGCLVRFISPDVSLRTVLPLGKFRAYSSAKLDVFPFPLPKFRFPTLDQRSTIVDALQENLNIGAVHFVPPLIIVELSATDGREYERKTLPGKAGGLYIMYHHGEESFWSGSGKAGYARFIAFAATANDTAVQAGDWFECDGISTGRIALCARSLEALRPN